MNITIQNNASVSLLLKRFNNRDTEAFSQIYLKLYDDLYYFASSLYHFTEVSADDIVQDAFLKLWENRYLTFPEIVNIKAYLIIGIKNQFKNYIAHRKVIDKHSRIVLLDESYFITQIVETEFVSLFRDAVDLLPEECGKVFTEFLNGLDIKEIAEKLNKSEFTVYKQRNRAISILKNKLSHDKMLIVIALFS